MSISRGDNRNVRGLPYDAEGKREWSNGLFDCLGDVDTCALRIPVPIIHIHVISEQVYWHGVVHASHTEEIADALTT